MAIRRGVKTALELWGASGKPQIAVDGFRPPQAHGRTDNAISGQAYQNFMGIPWHPDR
jgi:hypothetical protein